MDPATLAVGAAVGGGVGTLAALVVWALIARFAYRLWMDFDSLRSQSMAELRAENAHLREQLKEATNE